MRDFFRLDKRWLGLQALKYDPVVKRARARLRHSTLQFTRGRVDLNDND